MRPFINRGIVRRHEVSAFLEGDEVALGLNVVPEIAVANNNAGGNENCGLFLVSDLGLNDASCEVTQSFTCEVYCGVVPDNFVFDECIDGVQLFF